MAEKRSVLGAMLDHVLGAAGAKFPSMDPVELLKQQHRAVDDLFARLESARGRARAGAFDELLTALSIHAELEEQVLYPALKAQAEDLLLEAVEEHLAVKRLLADLIDLDPGDPVFQAKITVLRESVHHHVREEETQLLPLASRIFDDDTKEALLAAMVTLEMELREGGGFKEAVAGSTDKAAPI